MISGSEKWIPLSDIQSFFNYRATQLASLLKDDTLVVAKVGKRKFVKRESLEAFLEKKSK